MRRQLTLGDLTVTVADEARLGFLALITGRVVDDLATPALDLPKPGPAQIVARLRGVDPTGPGEDRRFSIIAGAGGLFGVAAENDWALAQLTAVAHIVDLTIGAPGFLPVTRSVNIPAGAAFPIPLPDIRLRRPAVRLRGRLMSTGGPVPVPLPGRTVAVTAPAGLTGFHTPTGWAHTAGTPIVPLTVTLVGPDLALRGDVFPGDTQLRLGRRTNLAVGSLIHLGTVDDDLVRVAALTGPATLTDPGTAVLATPITRVHRAGAPAQRATVVASGPSATTITGTDAAALITLVDHPERLPDGTACRIDDADPTRVEYRSTHAPSATTDAAGYYRTGPVGAARTATVTVTPSAPPVAVTVVLRYDQPDNVLNLSA